MANIIRWEPYNEVMSLRDAMDDLFAESYITPRVFGQRQYGGNQLALDVVETENDVIVKASVPGIKPEELDITVVGDTLSIKGESKSEVKQEKANYLMQERRFGSFRRSITLPVSVQSDKAVADFENGVLTLTLPKAEEVKPKQIKVSLKNGSK